MEIEIRKAKQQEYEAVEAIYKQVQKLHVQWRPDIYQHVEQVLSKEEYQKAVEEETLFVAAYQEKVVGILHICFRHVKSPTQVERKILFIDAMAVDEKFRGNGIGHRFFDFLREHKMQCGCDGIELQVNARNEAAYQMYRNYGFTEKSINMELL
ncbi:MAG: GNAT family N-acetyltransferase [Lachnospiraceae bacterium]